MVGLEENLFPSQMSLTSRQDLEEERRLFYVAITRAEEHLTLSYATSRFKYGNLIPCDPSRFIEEIDKQFMDVSMLHQAKAPNIAHKSPNDANFGKGYGLFVGKSVTKPLPDVNASADFKPDDPSSIQVGQNVEHQRFGLGVVQQLEGEGDHKKAVIQFQEMGQKTLVLRFAKLMIRS